MTNRIFDATFALKFTNYYLLQNVFKKNSKGISEEYILNFAYINPGLVRT